MPPATSHISWSGTMNRAHVANGIFASANAAMK
jgi:hypothetical protein